MGRKSKQAGTGHYPLTHYERTKKFASSSYGTTTTRISGDTQVAFGSCSLSLAPIVSEQDESPTNAVAATSSAGDDDNTVTSIAMVTPSGHLYAKQAIYEYLLTKTQDYSDQKKAYEMQEEAAIAKADTTEAKKRQREEAFEESNQLAVIDSKKKAKNAEKIVGDGGVLKKTSYWLPDMQPAKVDLEVKAPERPASPYSGEPLRRKDLRELALLRKKENKSKNYGEQDVLCAISGKAIRMQKAVAYWTKDKSRPGVVVLKSVYDMTIDTSSKKNKETSKNSDKKTPALICPITNAKIKHTIELKSGGSGFAAHNAVQVKTYKPTITWMCERAS